MKYACNYCDRTAHGTVDELTELGWSRTTIYKPFSRRFVACWRHGNLLAADVEVVLKKHKETMARRRWNP